jgi:glutathione peroxidase-family protein
MVKKRLLFGVLIALFSWGCSSEQAKKQAVISGQFSVADSLSESQQLLPIGIDIIHRDSTDAAPDTLFHTVTDSSGAFSGTAMFEEKGQYSTFLSSSGQRLGQLGIILAEGDSVTINGTLPNAISISSREHDAMQQFQRLNSGFQRIVQFANAGRLSQDTLEQELSKWSNLYLDLYNESPNTKAAELAAAESVRLLQDWNSEKMMSRLKAIRDNDAVVQLAADYGKEFYAQNEGLTAALAYLDTLSNITEEREPSMRISMERIKLLYDSARVSTAQERLDKFKQEYKDDSTATQWVESINYDLNYLSPGDSIPSFQFTEKGAVVSRDSLLGKSYIFEVTRLANSLYQEQFERTVVIYNLYKNFGLDVVTIPLDESQATVDAFFEERAKLWSVADAQAFDRQKLLKEFNVRLIPTRFLINEDGEIVRKYVGREFQDVIKDLQTLINQDKN